MTFCRLVIVERSQSSVVVGLDLPLALVCHIDLPASPCAIAGLASSIGNENTRRMISQSLYSVPSRCLRSIKSRARASGPFILAAD